MNTSKALPPVNTFSVNNSSLIVLFPLLVRIFDQIIFSCMNIAEVNGHEDGSVSPVPIPFRISNPNQDERKAPKGVSNFMF